jgi:hypothetical protein
VPLLLLLLRSAPALQAYPLTDPADASAFLRPYLAARDITTCGAAVQTLGKLPPDAIAPHAPTLRRLLWVDHEALQHEVRAEQVSAAEGLRQGQ